MKMGARTYVGGKSVYAPELDELLWQRSKEVGEGVLVLVQIYRYGEGVPKVQVVRHDERRFGGKRKLNRLGVVELEAALPLLQEALTVLKKRQFDERREVKGGKEEREEDEAKGVVKGEKSGKKEEGDWKEMELEGGNDEVDD